MKEFETIKAALNKANKSGVFDLNESQEIVKCILAVEELLKDEKSE